MANVACDGKLRLSAKFFLSMLLALRTYLSGETFIFPGKEEIMPIGTVKFFNADKGYGFIQPEDGGNDSFVHISAVERSGMSTLQKDQRVSYDIENDQRGKQSAVNLSAA